MNVCAHSLTLEWRRLEKDLKGKVFERLGFRLLCHIGVFNTSLKYVDVMKVILSAGYKTLDTLTLRYPLLDGYYNAVTQNSLETATH